MVQGNGSRALAIKRADAVFEGGGVKGIGLVGALLEIEKAGYHFENLAGSSAGAIVAVLLAAGYGAADIASMLHDLDYTHFMDEGFLDRLGLCGKALSVGFEYGIYEGRDFEGWLGEALRCRGKTRFGDLQTSHSEERFRHRVQIVASDLTDHRLLVLPRDLRRFGLDPDEFSLARAVRMSMSIPFFFEPVRLRDASGRVHIIVDGGVLSNYPIWLLDDGTSDPPWPTFGFKLIEPDEHKLRAPTWNPVGNVITFLQATISTMLEAHDRYHISRSKGDWERTIGISTVIDTAEGRKSIDATDFDLDPEEAQKLFDNGISAARSFLAHWDFEEWKRKYRGSPASVA